MFKGFKDLLSKVEQRLDSGINLLDQSMDATVKTIQGRVKPLQDKVQETTTPAVANAVSKLNQIQLNIDLNKPKRFIEVLKEETTKRTALVVSFDSQQIQITPEQYKGSANFSAGLEFLQWKEATMKALHEKNVTLFNMAEDADGKIRQSVAWCKNHSDTWSSVQTQLATIPDMLNNITKINSEIATICSRVENLELALEEQLAKLSKEQAESFEQSQQAQTLKLQRQKQNELASLEEEFKINKAKKEVHQLEVEKLLIRERLREQEILAKEKERADRIREQELLLERERMRAALDESFRKDVESFRKKGEAPRRKKKSRRRTKNLEDIVVDDDKSKLDEFLGPEESTEATAGTTEQDNDEDDA